VIATLTLVTFILVALYSCVYAFRRLTRPGISSEVRFVFIRKHIFYVSVFIFLWTFSLSHLYFQIYAAAQDLQDKDDKLSTVNRSMMFISTISTMLTGFVMSMIRIREPYMKFLMTKWYRGLFGELMSEKDTQVSQQYVNDSLATFLTSSLNVELVHVILDSITKHTKSFIDPSRNYLEYMYDPSKFKDKHTFIIDTIRIKD
jgi:hypothetical protein